MAYPDARVPQKKESRFNKFWRTLTHPKSKNEETARQEYTTKVILVFLLFIIIPLFFIGIVGLVYKIIPFDTVLIVGIMIILFVFGWLLAHFGHPQLGGLIPCILFYGTGVFGNFVGGIDAPAMLIYAMSILLAAILLGSRAQMIFLVLSLISFFGLGMAHDLGYLTSARSASNMFVNRVTIVFAALTGISLGVWFLKNQYQRTLSEVRSSAENKKAILETVVDGIVFSDLQGNIIDLNNAMLRMFDISEKEMVIGKPIFHFLVPDEIAPIAESYKSMTSDLTPHALTCHGQLKDGTQISLEIKSAIFVNPDGKPAGFVSTIRNITEQQKIEKELVSYREHLEDLVTERTLELKEAYTELESFSYSISHDLKSPLRGIDGYVTLLSKDYRDQLSGQALIYLERINEGIAHMAELINDLLTFSRLFRQPVSRKLVHPEEIARIVGEQLANGDYKNQVVEYSISEVPYCYADPILMHQVFFNLFDNALKYSKTRPKSIVSFGAKTGDKNETIYFVRDNGVGFDMKYAENLFGVFQRLHNERDYEGTGIGLATVQRIIRRHNGKIWVESTVGEGSIFYFTIGDETGKA